jgi:hypothetical protein
MKIDQDTINLLLDSLIEYAKGEQDKAEYLEGLGLPNNHPIAYQSRARMRHILNTLNALQREYGKQHSVEDCPCGRTPEEIETAMNDIATLNNELISRMDALESGLTPMTKEEGITAALSALGMPGIGFQVVSGDDIAAMFDSVNFGDTP